MARDADEMKPPGIVRSQVTDQLAELIVAIERPHPVRVAIDGRSGAGKSTLGDELAALIRRRGRPAIQLPHVVDLDQCGVCLPGSLALNVFSVSA